MIWVVDDDGAITFRLRTPTTPFGPAQAAAGQAGADTVHRILKDMEMQNIDVESDGLLTRVRRVGGDEVSETVWRGRLIRLGQVAEAREYFRRLSQSFSGS